MREYEVTVIFQNDDESFKKGLEAVKSNITAIQGEIKKEDDLKSREFAYPIKKETRGHYYYMEMNADPAKIIELEKSFKLTQEVLKYLFVKKD